MRKRRRIDLPRTPKEFEAAFEKAFSIPPQRDPDEVNPLTGEELFLSTHAPDILRFADLCSVVGISMATEQYSHLEHCGFVSSYVRPEEVKTWPEAARLAINRHLSSEELKHNS